MLPALSFAENRQVRLLLRWHFKFKRLGSQTVSIVARTNIELAVSRNSQVESGEDKLPYSRHITRE